MKNHVLLIIYLLSVSCVNGDGLIANYHLNGNLNDYALASIAEPKGNVNFVKTKHTKGLKYINKKPLSFLVLPDIDLSTKEYTISMMVKFKNFSHNNSLFFFGTKNETWGSSGLWLYTDNNKLAVFQEKQVLSNEKYMQKHEKNTVFINSKSLKTNVLYLTTFTYKNEILTIYLNENEYATYTNVKPIKAKERIALIGIANDPKAKGKFQFEGIIDEIKIYNKSLTKKEVQSLFYSYQTK